MILATLLVEETVLASVHARLRVLMRAWSAWVNLCMSGGRIGTCVLGLCYRKANACTHTYMHASRKACMDRDDASRHDTRTC